MSENLATDAADPIDPECVVHCLAFFYEEGKGGEDYRKLVLTVTVIFPLRFIDLGF